MPEPKDTSTQTLLPEKKKLKLRTGEPYLKTESKLYERSASIDQRDVVITQRPEINIDVLSNGCYDEYQHEGGIGLYDADTSYSMASDEIDRSRDISVKDGIIATRQLTNTEDSDEESDLEVDIQEWLRTDVPPQEVTSATRYISECANLSTVPVSYLLRHADEDKLRMRYRSLCPVGTRALSEMLKTNITLSTIDLTGNHIGDDGCQALAAVFQENNTITDLILSENSIDGHGACRLFDALKDNCSLRLLDLSVNEINDVAASSLQLYLEKNEALYHLSLNGNHLENISAKSISIGLKMNFTLKSLDLSWNKFLCDGAKNLVHSLKHNNGLTTFNFAMNGLGIKGSETLSEALKVNSTLLHLDVSSNRIPPEGAGSIAVALKTNETLSSLNIGRNPLGSDCAKVLLMAIERNNYSAIELLDLTDVPVTIEFAELQKKLEESRDLHVIHGGILNDISDKLKNVKESDHPYLRDPMRKLKQYVEKTGYRILDLFKELDRDQSMSVSIHEFRVGIQKANIDLNEEQIEILIEKLDVDGDGEIDYREFIEADNKFREEKRDFTKAAEAKKRSERKCAQKSGRRDSLMDVIYFAKMHSSFGQNVCHV